ncbi:MAG: CDGSH iron-sulfur domain-containing protein [Methanoculleus sp.]
MMLHVIEPALDESIVVVEDTFRNMGRGGIPIESADKRIYTVRNRVALCRCRRSRNEPFCD